MAFSFLHKLSGTGMYYSVPKANPGMDSDVESKCLQTKKQKGTKEHCKWMILFRHYYQYAAVTTIFCVTLVKKWMERVLISW